MADIIELVGQLTLSPRYDGFVHVVFDIGEFLNVGWPGAELSSRQPGLLLGHSDQLVDVNDDLL